MNLEQLKAILWLRWRLSVNQARKAGELNFVLMMIVVWSALILAGLSFFLTFAAGIFLLPDATPMTVMVIWDVGIGILLFSWSISLLIEIQRSEMLSLEKLLHLPMTLKDAFVLNYLSSLICLNLVCFFPTAMGLCGAMAVTFGPRMLILIPIVLSFILMLTAVTYQFRGWLAALMADKRRKRTVVTLFTFAFVALSQVPNIVVQLSIPKSGQAESQRAVALNEQMKLLSEALGRNELTKEDYDRGIARLNEEYKQKKKDADAAKQATLNEYLTLANKVVPFGWVAYSSKSLLAGSNLPALLSLFGMTSIGVASLWRSYSSTINYYTGNARSRVTKLTSLASPAKGKPSNSNRLMFMEWKLPKLSEHATATALCCFRNLVRAPEAKMLFIGPMIIGVMFVLMIFTNRTPTIPSGLEPLVWLGGIVVLTFMCQMLMLNIFGMDRSGVRCFILMPTQRSEILLGKNLAMLPILCGIGVVVAVGLFYLAPLGPISLLACCCQLLISFFLASLSGNWVSIQFPIAMAAGTGKPVQVNLVTMLVQMVVIMAGPIFLFPAALFFGIEWALWHFFSIGYLPVFALLSVIELWLVYRFYLYVLRLQGRLLQRRETQILEILTANAE